MFIKTLSLTSTGISFSYVLFNPVVNIDKTNKKEKINKKTIVNALGNEREIQESRQMIKALVKEIDNCITILNAEQQ